MRLVVIFDELRRTIKVLGRLYFQWFSGFLRKIADNKMVEAWGIEPQSKNAYPSKLLRCVVELIKVEIGGSIRQGHPHPKV